MFEDIIGDGSHFLIALLNDDESNLFIKKEKNLEDEKRKMLRLATFTLNENNDLSK